MNEEDKCKIVRKIKDDILETKKKIEKYSSLSKPIAPENSIGRVSRMDAINNKSIVESALRESEKKLNDLKYIESQINEANFGTCSNCKTSIPFGRIIFQPQSRYCVNCAK
tara:strand:+ start:1210 stop:1542 length:333 start_codon:yes stop_codon:yes gene_type:complete